MIKRFPLSHAIFLALLPVPIIAGEPADSEPPGWVELGIAPLSGTKADLHMQVLDGRFALYAQAEQAVVAKRQCMSALPAKHDEISQAFSAMTRTQNEYVSAAQWQAFEAALVETKPVAPISEGSGMSLHCDAAVHAWGMFDDRVDAARAALREQNELEEVARSIKQDGVPMESRGSIGILFGPSTVVSGVLEGSPAARAGIRARDHVLSIDGRKVASVGGVIASLARVPHGQAVEVEVRRIDFEAMPPASNVLRMPVTVVPASELEGRDAVGKD